MYCKFENFHENFIFANSIKIYISQAKNSRLGHDLLTSVNDRVISPFPEGFIFSKLRTREVSKKIKPSRKFQIYSDKNYFLSNPLEYNI